MSSLAARLRQARKRVGVELSQTELAEKAGVSQGTVGNIEGGKRGGLESLPLLAEALGVRYRWLRDGEEPMFSSDRPWPFPNIEPERFEKLADWQRFEIQGVVRERIDSFERPAPVVKARPLEVAEKTPFEPPNEAVVTSRDGKKRRSA